LGGSFQIEFKRFKPIARSREATNRIAAFSRTRDKLRALLRALYDEEISLARALRLFA
jgi:hypothetical protein